MRPARRDRGLFALGMGFNNGFRDSERGGEGPRKPKIESHIEIRTVHARVRFDHIFGTLRFTTIKRNASSSMNGLVEEQDMRYGREHSSRKRTNPRVALGNWSLGKRRP